LGKKGEENGGGLCPAKTGEEIGRRQGGEKRGNPHSKESKICGGWC